MYLLCMPACGSLSLPLRGPTPLSSPGDAVMFARCAPDRCLTRQRRHSLFPTGYLWRVEAGWPRRRAREKYSATTTSIDRTPGRPCALAEPARHSSCENDHDDDRGGGQSLHAALARMLASVSLIDRVIEKLPWALRKRRRLNNEHQVSGEGGCMEFPNEGQPRFPLSGRPRTTG